MVVDDDYTIRVAPFLDRAPGPLQDWIGRFDGQSLRLEGDTTPAVSYLQRHRAKFEWTAAG